jgi:arabinogalactan endo-1,4-beta-galactosidase
MRLNNTLQGLGNKGIGFCYWAPDAVAFKGPQATDGSVWENVAVFDFENAVLPVIEVFNEGPEESR